MESSRIQNAFTIDVEDYFQVSAFEHDVKRSDWQSIPSRVEKNTNIILDVLEKFDVKGTFFVLGWIAERHQDLVKRIFDAGHEIASHGYSHKLIYNQTVSEFREETIMSKKILEDIIQVPVIGYRAASYSITNRSLWALDILNEAGFKYDSSIFPVYHDRYGIADARQEPHVMACNNGGDLVEFPLSVYEIFKYKLPVSGGGYFRLYPYQFTKWALESLNKSGKGFVFYLHPWEVDPKQPKIKTNLLSRFRHYNNLDICKNRLERLITDFNFTTMRDVLAGKKLIGLNND
jgi:polysaccharide deacetylase family protein (PEP-CTERM system associated)